MRERIIKILEDKNLTQAAFADLIGVGRPSITHLMTGRDKYSQVVASKTLLTFPDINPMWFLKGEGNMYKNIEKNQSETNSENKQKINEIDDDLLFPDMYDESDYQKEKENEIIRRESDIRQIPLKDESIRSSENAVNTNISTQTPPLPQIQSIATEQQPIKKKIEKIVFFYVDQTFEEYYPKS